MNCKAIKAPFVTKSFNSDINPIIAVGSVVDADN